MLINMHIALTLSLGIQVQIVPPAPVNETQVALICVQRVPGGSTLALGITATVLLSTTDDSAVCEPYNVIMLYSHQQLILYCKNIYSTR